MVSRPILSTSSLMTPGSLFSSPTRTLSTMRCIRLLGLSGVGRKSLNDARWWLTIDRSLKKASTSSRMWYLGVRLDVVGVAGGGCNRIARRDAGVEGDGAAGGGHGDRLALHDHAE